ncbi:Sec8 exocyst complex component-specific domain-containing protein [Neohortaea acidophila]|uniref:Exocyst complex component Sec8 n=1 Tax=Neohortaea acidophila TaxID=245834 RepID=A0A6A6PXN3_9PEZI|nr:Sec8 exocyst complex component-specific domain-containing protein [Neohortaea acidophila]KAF2484494.1 Sec8 exocyst complex component-specific domain-containing protein [Neohortaea acidophila]
MSYMRQPAPNGYASQNGSQGPPPSRRFDLETSSIDTSADERSRSRPGFHTNHPYDHRPSQPDQVHGVSRLNRENAHRRSRDYEWNQSRSRSRPASRPGAASRYGPSGGGAQVEDVLRYIESRWAFMATPSCIPVKVALQLKDSSSLGLANDMDQFHSAHAQLENALKTIVNEHHQAFNSSIGTFHKIQQAIHTSQQRVRTLRGGLTQAKANLAASRHAPELKVLMDSSASYDRMLEAISTIEKLQVVPDQLEAQLREKRYLGAVENLLEALKLVRKAELDDIGALGEMRVRLSNQEQILTDMLVEELHNHLYLKSPYCEERWKSHYTARNLSALATPGIADEDRALHSFLASYNGTEPMQEEPTRNAEADSFYFIQLLVESLHKMSKLDVAADRIEERLPIEFHRLLERTLGEVEQRHPAMALKGSHRRQTPGSDIDPERRAVLEDLLHTLFAKFEAIAEAHRVLHEVTAAVLKRDAVASDEAGALNRSFRELWKLLQSEMRSLLHDHLATDAGDPTRAGGRREKDTMTVGNMFNSQPRDRSVKLFRLADTREANQDLATEREDLEGILRSSVPGLVNSSKDASAKTVDVNGDLALRDRATASAAGHKLLVDPSVFNMGILLPPAIAFLNNLKAIVPPGTGTGTLTSFMDDFLLNIFYPQLDETLLELSSRCINDLDTFQPDPAWQSKASRPIFKGAARFYDLLERFCGLLAVLPHERSFVELVIAQMRAYYDRCYSWSKGLLQRVDMSYQLDYEQGGGVSGAEPGAASKMRMAAELATQGEVCEIVLDLLKLGGGTQREQDELAQKEADLLLRLAKRRELEDADLIHDRKTLTALCTLHVSLKWLASKCKRLRFLSPWSVDTANTQAHRNRRWTAYTQDLHSDGVPGGTYLPLDDQTAEQFDAVLISFTELSTLVLRTLHVDLRLHLLHGVYKATDTTYLLNQPYNDPDPNISELAESISTYCAQLQTHLLEPQYGFLTAHLATLVNTALIGLVGSIPAMDAFGNQRMALNILVLSQILKQLQPPLSTSTTSTLPGDLTRAARFYELASLGPQSVVEQGPDENFAREDLKALCRLCWNEARDSPSLGDMEKYVMKLGGWPRRQQSLSRKASRPRLGNKSSS